MNIKEFNVIAGQTGLELVKGEGYFYWADHKHNADIPSVYVSAFSHLSAESWLQELNEAIRLQYIESLFEA